MNTTENSSDQEVRTTPTALHKIIAEALQSVLENYPQPTTEPDTPLTEKQAATLIGVQPNTLSIWRSKSQGGPDYFLAGRNVRYRRQDVDSYIEKNLIKHQ